MQDFRITLVCLVVIVAAAPITEAANDHRCPSIIKFESASKNEKRKITLTPKAAGLASCSSSNLTPSLEGLKESKIGSWWVVHTSDEDVGRLSDIAEQNHSVLISVNQWSLGERPKLSFLFWGVDLQSGMKAAEDVCRIPFRIRGETHPNLYAIQEFSDSDESFCEGLAVVLAVHGLRLFSEDDSIVVSE